MKNRVIEILILFVMISMFVLNCGQSVKYIAEDDEIIDWQSYSEEWLV